MLEPIDGFCDHCLSLVVWVINEAFSWWLLRFSEPEIFLRADLVVLVHVDALQTLETGVTRVHPVRLNPSHPRRGGLPRWNFGVSVNLLE